MVRVILYIVIILTLTSCYTRRECLKFCPEVKQESTIIEKIKDSIIVSYKDTTIYLKLPKDTLYKIDTVYIGENSKFSTKGKSILTNEFCESVAYVKNNKLYHNLYFVDTTLKIKLDNAIKEVIHWKNLYLLERKNNIEIIEKIPVLYKILSFIGLICISALFAFTFFYIKYK